jgi:hypothetical protein
MVHTSLRRLESHPVSLSALVAGRTRMVARRGAYLQSATTIEDDDMRELNCAVDSIWMVLDMTATPKGLRETKVFISWRDAFTYEFEARL